MNFVKKNLFLVILATMMVAATIALGISGSAFHKKKTAYENEVEDIIKAEQGFSKTPYALTYKNLERSEENYKLVNKNLKSLIDTLREQYPPIETNSNITPIKCKRLLRQTCIKMESLLKGSEIWTPPSLRYFSYDQYMQPEVLPTDEDIPFILQQLEIVQEVIFLISQSRVKKVLNFQRPDKLKPVKKELYRYTTFEIVLSGNIEAIQAFMHSLYGAKYLFSVLSLSLKIDRVPQNNPPSSNSEQKKDDISPKSDRLVFSGKPEVTANIVLDYYHFTAK